MTAQDLRDKLNYKKEQVLRPIRKIIEELTYRISEEMIINGNIDYFASTLYFEIVSWKNDTDFEVKLLTDSSTSFREFGDSYLLNLELTYGHKFTNLEAYVFLSELKNNGFLYYYCEKNKTLVIAFKVKDNEETDDSEGTSFKEALEKNSEEIKNEPKIDIYKVKARTND